MEENWIIKKSRKADESKDLIILEKPDVKNYLDALLLEKYWPIIEGNLEKTNYYYIPQEEPETDFKLGHVLQRSLLFMLFDENKAFFRGQLNCSKDFWMLESEFFLGLAKENNPLVIFEILGNSRFLANPPSLTINENSPYYYNLILSNGEGANWSSYSESEITKKIKKLVKVNVQLYEYSKDGFLSEEELGAFLTAASKIYEAM